MKVLIAYATKYGCTEKCAKILSEKLSGKVDLCNLKKVRNIDLLQYDKIIIGGSVYMGRIRKEVKKFCQKNFNVLKEKKIGLFICGMAQGDMARNQLNNVFPQELLSNAIAKESFGGEFVFKKMNPFERFIIKMVSKHDKSNPPLDISQDVSTISVDSIEKFAELINNA